MARSINIVIMMGNMTRDPELRNTPNGQSVCSFGMALNRAYKDQSGNWQESVDYVDVVAWGPLAERINQYCKKGKRIMVQGRLQYRQWEQDGQKRNKLEVNASDVTFMDNAGASSGEEYDNGGNPQPSSTSKPKDTVIDDISDEPIDLSEIPF